MNWVSSVRPSRNFEASVSKSSNSRSRIGMTSPGTLSYTSGFSSEPRRPLGLASSRAGGTDTGSMVLLVRGRAGGEGRTIPKRRLPFTYFASAGGWDQPQGSGSPQGVASFASCPTASRRAARCHGLRRGSGGTGGGAVSRMKRSRAAATAAASSGDALGATISSLGRRFTTARPRLSWPAVPELPVLDHDAVLGAVSPAEAFVRYHRGEWAMPPKVYLDSPPHGDFRAMPARGSGLALLKWVTSFPGNPERGLPVVAGAVVVSDAASGELVAIMDC